MTAEKSDNETLHRLAEAITNAGMGGPATFFLDMVRPFDFISSQIALFVRPFTIGMGWEGYTRVLAEEPNWQALRHLLHTAEERDHNDAAEV
jgi:hypothetical protein